MQRTQVKGVESNPDYLLYPKLIEKIIQYRSINPKKHCIDLEFKPSIELEFQLTKYFKKVLTNPKKNLEQFNISCMDKYDFFGHTAYIDTPSSEELYAICEIIEPDLQVHDKETIENIYSILEKNIRTGYKKLETHKMFDLLKNDNDLIDTYNFLLPVISPHKCRCQGNVEPNLGLIITFSNNDRILHELVESIACIKYSPKIASLFANAASNIISGFYPTYGICTSKHEFIDKDEEENYQTALRFSAELPHNKLDDFIIEIIEATKESKYTSFKNIDCIELFAKQSKNISNAPFP